jgi:hypothetical protein
MSHQNSQASKVVQEKPRENNGVKKERESTNKIEAEREKERKGLSGSKELPH